jgi:dCTP deaminase
VSILTGPEIVRRVRAGAIVIDPFDAALVNPASVDLRLGRGWRRYAPTLVPGGSRDIRVSWPSECFEIPEGGLVLFPSELTLLHTAERVGSRDLVCCLDGKSSVARMGICVHLTAGFGDPGFVGQYTLEVTTVYPVRIYAGMRFCQVRFHEVVGEIARYAGHYVGDAAVGPVPSMCWKQFEEDQR